MTEEHKPTVIIETLDDIIIPQTSEIAIPEPRQRYENEETFHLVCKGSSPNDSDDRVRRFMGTLETRDRKGDEVLLKGWNFKPFMRNPIVIWNHRLSGELTDILGRVKRIKREKITKGQTILEGWVFDVWFAPGPSEAHPNMHPNGDLALSLLDMKVLNACSVTFRPIHSEWIEEEEEERTERRAKRRNELPGMRWITKEMLEFSVCMVGAHKDALQMAKTKGITLPDFMRTDLEGAVIVSKPGWDNKDEYTEIRYRVREPSAFEEESFRRVAVKQTKPRVIAVMGRLKGKTTLTIQALRFPKGDGWTLAKAKAWLKDHKELTKSLVELYWVDEPGDELAALQIDKSPAVIPTIWDPTDQSLQSEVDAWEEASLQDVFEPEPSQTDNESGKIYTPSQTTDQLPIEWNEPADVQDAENRKHRVWLDTVKAEAEQAMRRRAAASLPEETHAELVTPKDQGPTSISQPTTQRPSRQAEQVAANLPSSPPLKKRKRRAFRLVRQRPKQKKKAYTLIRRKRS